MKDIQRERETMTLVCPSVKKGRKKLRITLKCYRTSMERTTNLLLLCYAYGPEQSMLAFVRILSPLLVDLPTISQSRAKKPHKQESLSDTISEAAVSIVHAFIWINIKGESKRVSPSKTASVSVKLGWYIIMSVELQMKIFEQLRNYYMRIIIY